MLTVREAQEGEMTSVHHCKGSHCFFCIYFITCISDCSYFYLKWPKLGQQSIFLPFSIKDHETKIIYDSKNKVVRKLFCLASAIQNCHPPGVFVTKMKKVRTPKKANAKFTTLEIFVLETVESET